MTQTLLLIGLVSMWVVHMFVALWMFWPGRADAAADEVRRRWPAAYAIGLIVSCVAFGGSCFFLYLLTDAIVTRLQ